MNNRLRVAAISRHSADVDACFSPIKRPPQRVEAGRAAVLLLADVWGFYFCTLWKKVGACVAAGEMDALQSRAGHPYNTLDERHRGPQTASR